MVREESRLSVIFQNIIQRQRVPEVNEKGETNINFVTLISRDQEIAKDVG